MDVKIFVQDQCPNCPPAKKIGEKLQEEGVNISYHDIKSVDGLSEAIMFDVMTTPSIVIADKNNSEIHSWRGNVPDLEEIKSKLANE